MKTTGATMPDAQTAAAALPAAEQSIEELRRSLMRKMEIFASDWRRCPLRRCRRTHACNPPDIICHSPRREPPPMTPDQKARMMADLKRELARRLGAR